MNAAEKYLKLTSAGISKVTKFIEERVTKVIHWNEHLFSFVVPEVIHFDFKTVIL